MMITPIGISRIGAALLMLIQSQDLDMTSMVERFLELRSFHNSKLGSLTLYIEEEDDIDAKLVALDQKLMVHSFRNLALESLKDDNKKMERNKLEYLPQYIHPSNKGKQDLFGEWMDSVERMDAFVTDKPTDMEIDGEATVYMDEDPMVLMLREDGAH
ncbi:hypothetical protein SO802_028151 [Lithocarpus litseifolius]|uniref:Uncharacterized protein n=1 Tax=Lithocarpus litseifolius TaxID=425828 RepID=A0AAW2BQ32_9ROSI